MALTDMVTYGIEYLGIGIGLEIMGLSIYYTIPAIYLIHILIVTRKKYNQELENNIRTYDRTMLVNDIRRKMPKKPMGSGGLFKEINDSFKQAEIGKEYEVVVPAKDAYGMRENKNIKVVPMRSLVL